MFIAGMRNFLLEISQSNSPNVYKHFVPTARRLTESLTCWLSFSANLTSGRAIFSSLLIFSCASSSFAQAPRANPTTVSVSARQLAGIDAAVNQAIAMRKLPGAVVLVGRKDRVIWRRAYGSRAVEPKREAMTRDTIFDVASLTKVVATGHEHYDSG